MTQFIDRRLNGKNKSAVNRQRFIRRYKTQIKQAVSNAISKRKITEIDKEGEKIIIPNKDTNEPTITHGHGGVQEGIFAGNKNFSKGDRIPRVSEDQSAKGEQASNTGEGTDDFIFELSRDEFVDLYFEDLALPDLVKKEIAHIPSYKTVRAGFSTAGTPTNINIIRSMRQAVSRRIALETANKVKLKKLEDQLKALEDKKTPDNLLEMKAIQEEISKLKKRISSIAFIDPIDIRYNNRVRRLAPTTQAVMFCIMDVSGSMDETKKDISKRFFILLYLFLTKTYEKIELVFIRHHTSAKEVNEEEFFYSRETGGTVVSSALELMRDIIKTRYQNSSWNIYAAEASDGDNWNADSPYCKDLLVNDIMPLVQYFAYIEIMPRHHQSLWEAYLTVQNLFPNFAMQNINELSDIYPVFRELFKRKIL